MAATFTTKEHFEAGTTIEGMDETVRLRMQAGAIRSEYTGSKDEGWNLETEWNVIGEQ